MEKVFKWLRIICCCLSALGAAACIPVFIWTTGVVWGIITIVVAVIFFVLMILFKRLQEDAEVKNFTEEPRGDFITGPVKRDGESQNESLPADAAEENTTEENK